MGMPKGSVRYRDGSWHYRIDYGKIGGKRQQREICGFETEDAAKDALVLAQAEFLNLGIIPSHKKMTFEQIYKIFIEEECPTTRAYATIIKYKSIFLNHCLEYFGPHDINDISQIHIDKKIKLWAEIYSFDYANGMYHFLFAVFAFAQQRRYIKYNPMLDVNGPKRPRDYKEVRFLSMENLDILKEVYRGSTQEAAFMLGLHLGVRVSECYALRWSDIDWEKETIKIDKQLQRQNGKWVFTHPKTTESYRTIKFGETLKKYLLKYRSEKRQAYAALHPYKRTETNLILDVRTKNLPTLLKIDDFILVKDNGEMYRPSSSKMLCLLAKNSGIPFKFHYLRHTHATYLATQAQPQDIMKRLGHTKPETTMRYYIHVPSEREAQAAIAVDELFGDTIEDKAAKVIDLPLAANERNIP